MKGTEAIGRDFLAYLKSECGFSGNTLKAYMRDCTRFFAWLEDAKVERWSELSIGKLGEYLAFLQTEQLSPASVARHVASLKTLFKFLVLDEHITQNAAETLHRPSLWNRVPTVLSNEDSAKLIASPKSRDRLYLRDRALLAMLAATGMRASEMAGLLLADVQVDQRYCKCRGKGNKERLVPFGEEAKQALETYLAVIRPPLVELRTDPGNVFLTTAGKPISRIEIWKLVKKYSKRAGLTQAVSPHTFRHSFATRMLTEGADLRAIQELLGHASITTTQHYTRVDADRLKKIHQKFHPRG